MKIHEVNVLGFGDNVVDKYEHIKTMYPGGNCVNFSVYAKRFGATRSAYMGYFGDDNEAEHVIDALKKEAIETFKCEQLEGENGCARVTLIDGERIFLGSNEGGIRGEVPFVLNRFDLEYIRQFDVVHSGNYCFTEKELHKIKENNVLISFDFSDDSTQEYYENVAKYVDFAFCSFDGSLDEAKIHLQKIISYGPKIAVASRGAEGSILYNGQKFYEQKAIPIDEVIDTMGAGDALLAAFLVSYLNEMNDSKSEEERIQNSLLEAAKFAASICKIEGAFGYGKIYK